MGISHGFRCPEAAYGIHSDPGVDGKCAWCGRYISQRMAKPNVEKQYDEDEPVIDPLTLEPVDPNERYDYLYEGRKRRG
jgi:hypothetical protein